MVDFIRDIFNFMAKFIAYNSLIINKFDVYLHNNRVLVHLDNRVLVRHNNRVFVQLNSRV